MKDGENDNIGTLHKLHPPSINLYNYNQQRVTRGAKLSQNNLHFVKNGHEGFEGTF